MLHWFLVPLVVAILARGAFSPPAKLEFASLDDPEAVVPAALVAGSQLPSPAGLMRDLRTDTITAGGTPPMCPESPASPLRFLEADEPQALAPVITEAISIYSRRWRAASIVLRGSGFGSGDAARYALTGGRIMPDDPRVRLWRDDLILIEQNRPVRGGIASVRTAAGRGARRFVTYDYTQYAQPAGSRLGLPLSVAADTTGCVWVFGEFHTQQFAYFNPATETICVVGIPHASDPYFAWVAAGGPETTHTSALAETTLVDTHGRVWLAQGGWYLYSGAHQNRSRVISFDPRAPWDWRFRIFNIPGDNQQVTGLAWDARRGRIWYTANRTIDAPARIGNFDPERVSFHNKFNFSTSLEDQLCAPGEADDGACFREVPLPERNFGLGHLAVDATGGVWYTGFWGTCSQEEGCTELGRLDPETGSIDRYPLSKSIGRSATARLVGPGPWELRVLPNGDVVFNEFFDNQIVRLPAQRIGDPQCRVLDPETLTNPCLVEVTVPDADSESQVTHSIEVDAMGRIWYSLADADPAATESPWGGSLGYIDTDGRIVRLPSLRRFGIATPNGLTIDDRGDVWFGNFLARELGRLRRVR